MLAKKRGRSTKGKTSDDMNMITTNYHSHKYNLISLPLTK